MDKIDKKWLKKKIKTKIIEIFVNKINWNLPRAYDKIDKNIKNN